MLAMFLVQNYVHLGTVGLGQGFCCRIILMAGYSASKVGQELSGTNTKIPSGYFNVVSGTRFILAASSKLIVLAAMSLLLHGYIMCFGRGPLSLAYQPAAAE